MSNSFHEIRARAAHSNRLDLVVFLSAFGGGLFIYFFGLLFEASQPVVTAGMLVVMGAYAIIAGRLGKLKVRLDQAGDNSYYLGLLFTLTSMARALYVFGSTARGLPAAQLARATSDQIISNFGIALATTIAGIFLRILLHQMRVDPAEVEDAARIELAEAAKRVRASLDALSLETSRLLAEMRQRSLDQLDGMIEDSQNAIRTFASKTALSLTELQTSTNTAQVEAVARTRDVTEKLVSVAEAVDAAWTRLQNVETPPIRLASRMDKTAESLERVAAQAEQMGEGLVAVGTELGLVNDALSRATEAAATMRDSDARRHEEALRFVEAASQKVGKALDDVGASLERERTLLVSIEEQAGRSARSVLDSQEAAHLVLKNLVDLSRQLTKVAGDAASEMPD